MRGSNFIAPVEPETPAAGDLIRGILWLLWQCIRVPALPLMILEPLFGMLERECGTDDTDERPV